MKVENVIEPDLFLVLASQFTLSLSKGYNYTKKYSVALGFEEVPSSNNYTIKVVIIVVI